MLLKKKGDEQLTALQTTFRRENLSLAGCSSAEPASVSVQQYKIQISKLYLQPVEIPSHFQSELGCVGLDDGKILGRVRKPDWHYWKVGNTC